MPALPPTSRCRSRTTPPIDLPGSVDLAERRAMVQRHNAWIKAFASTQGIAVLDMYQSVADLTTGGFLPGITTDGIHPTQEGSKAIADYLLTLPIPDVWKGGFAFARAVSESGNLVANGVFTGDTNADGLADSWTVLGGSGTPTLTPATGAGVTGAWQRITTEGQQYIIGQDISTGYDIGDVIEVAGRVRSSGGAAVQVRVSTWSANPSGTINPVYDLSYPLDGAFSGRTTVTPGTTKLRLQLQVFGAAGWAEFAEVAVRNLTALGIA